VGAERATTLVITGLSIAAAFCIGTIEIFGLLSSELHVHGWFWDWKLGNVEDRWQVLNADRHAVATVSQLP
jgi:high-affinity nickel permease